MAPRKTPLRAVADNETAPPSKPKTILQSAESGSRIDAMAAGDELAEAKIRYRLLAEVFEAEPKLRSNLNPALERAKAEILRLRAAKPSTEPSPAGKVVAFDPSRFKKSGA